MLELNENVFAKAKIIEKEKENLPEGVLCRAEYPICNLDSRNANNRIYGKDVWTKVLSDEHIVGKMDSRALFGHAEHPETLQSNIEKASHAVIGMSLDEESKKVNCVVDVLDTPHGRIVDTILKADCGIGMSTRAEGDLEESTDADGVFYKVKPESYNFITVDFTADPSTFGTLPSSVERNVVQEIRKGVFGNQLNEGYARSLLEKMQTREASTLLESISNESTSSNKGIINEKEDEIDKLQKELNDLESKLKVKVTKVKASDKDDKKLKGVLSKRLKDLLVLIGREKELEDLKKKLGESVDELNEDGEKESLNEDGMDDLVNQVRELEKKLKVKKSSIPSASDKENVDVKKKFKVRLKDLKKIDGITTKLESEKEKLSECTKLDVIGNVKVGKSYEGVDFNSMVKFLEKHYAELGTEQKKQLSESIKDSSDFDKGLVKNLTRGFLRELDEIKDGLKTAFDDKDAERFKGNLDLLKRIVDQDAKEMREVKHSVPEKKPKGFKDASKLTKMKEKIGSGGFSNLERTELIKLMQTYIGDMDTAIRIKNSQKFENAASDLIEFLGNEKQKIVEDGALVEDKDKLEDGEKFKILYDRIKKLHETRGELRNLLKGEKLNAKKMFKDAAKAKESFEQDRDELRQLVEHFKTVSDVMEENIEKEIKELKRSHTQELINCYIDSRVKWSGLKLSEKSLALLKECQTNDEVDTMIDGIQGNLRESRLHYNMPKEIKISGVEDPEVGKVYESIAVAMKGM